MSRAAQGTQEMHWGSPTSAHQLPAQLAGLQRSPAQQSKEITLLLGRALLRESGALRGGTQYEI